jgi:Phage-related minor tail protein
MADELDPVIARFLADTAGFVGPIQAMVSESNAAQERMGAVATEVATTMGAADTRIATEMEAMSAEVRVSTEAATGPLASLGAAADAMAAQVEAASARGAASLDRLSITAAGDAAKWEVDMATMSASMDRMSANVDAAAARAAVANEAIATSAGGAAAGVNASMLATGKSLMSSGGMIAGVAAAVAVGTGMMAATFDQKMELIRTNAHDSTDSIDAMSKSVLAMAGDVGQTPDKLAEGLYHITSTGQRGAAALDILRNSAKDATIGIADLDTVTYAMSGVMSIGMADVKNAADGVAYLNSIVGQGDMHMQDLSNAIGTGVLPAFKSAGLGMADFGAALSTLTDNSTPAEVAANHLKTTVQLLQNQSGPAAKALGDLGIKSGELGLDISRPGGLMVAVMDLKTHMDNYTKSAAGMAMSQADIGKAVTAMGAELTKEGAPITEQTDLLAAYKASLEKMGSSGIKAAADLSKAFGGARSAMTMETLVQESGKLQSKYNEMGSAASRQAQAQKDWNDTQAQFKVQLQDAKAAAEALAISVGQKLLPFMSGFLHVVSDVVGWLDKNKLAASMLAGVIGGALVAGVALLTAGFLELAIVIQGTPIGWFMDIVMGIAVLATVIVANWSSISGFFKDVWKSVVGFFSDAARDIGGFVGDVVKFVIDIPDKIGSALSSLGDLLGRLAVDGWRSFTHGLEVAWLATLSFLKNLPREIGFALGFLAGLLTKLAIDGWKGFTHGIETAFDDTIIWFSQLPDNLKKLTAKADIWLYEAGLKVLRGIKNGIVTAYEDVKKWFLDLPKNVENYFSNANLWLNTPGMKVIRGLGEGIVSAYKDVVNWFENLPRNVGSFFKDVGTWLLNAGKDLVMGLVHGFENAAGAVGNAIKSFAGGIVSGFKSAMGISSPSRVMAEEIGKWIPAGIAQGMNDNMHHTTNSALAMRSALLTALRGSAGIGLSVVGSAAGGAGGGSATAGPAGGTTIIVQGSIVDTQGLFSAVQTGTLRNRNINNQNGLVSTFRRPRG